MKAPKEIASKAERYKELKKEIDKLYEELEEFANENGFEDFWIDGFGVSQEPNGEEQTDGEYCDQWMRGEDVIDWLNNCFEFCGESKIVVNVGKDTNVPSNDGWIPVEERLPEDCEEIVLVQVSGKPADNILFDNAFEFALYEKEEGWMLDNYPEWKNPDVIAWQSLPKPYRQPKKEKSSCKEHIMSRFMKVE